MNYFMIGLIILNLGGGITFIIEDRPVLGTIFILASGISICNLLLGMGYK